VHVLSDESSGLLPVQPPQELRVSTAAVGGTVPVEPAVRAAVGDDELAGPDRNGGGRSGEESTGGVDPAVFSPSAKERRFPASSEPPLRDVQGGGLVVSCHIAWLVSLFIFTGSSQILFPALETN